MREKLLAFIASASEAAAVGDLRNHFELSVGGHQFPRIWFGAGYFDHRTVVLWTDADNYEQAPPEVAVDALLALVKQEPPAEGKP